EVGGPSAPAELLEKGSLGGPEVPHLVSPAPVVVDSSCFEISRPSSTPTMCMDLDPSELDNDVGPVLCEVTDGAFLQVHRVVIK
ncbi:hypothetical protein A2U01_0081509, partial [Trifolium medium]|nr:hypothetical protein [Trifolium medium]